jgi:hypothetical protein
VRAAAIAESNGCEKALRSVTRGAAVSTGSEEGVPSNMRDCVATLTMILHGLLGADKRREKEKRTG